MKKSIRIHYVDFWEHFSPESFFLHRIMSDNYTVLKDSENPEFLICSSFGNAHLSYDCLKLYYTGENIPPDFNVYDYAIGFDEIFFADRYIRVPLYRLYIRDGLHEICPDTLRLASPQKKFCNFCYSNSQAEPVREYFFRMLTQYKRVDSGGKFLNNIGFCVKDKITWQRDYKFSIAFENSSKPGYTTEKILDACYAHTIPIYWGNPEIAKDFNVKRIINCHEYSSFAEVIEQIIEIDNDSNKYESIISQPWFPEGKQPSQIANDPVIISFLRNIIEQSPEKARRTVKYGMTRHIYDMCAQRERAAGSLFFRLAQKLQRIFS